MRQDEKKRKKILVLNSIRPQPGKNIPKKIAKKFKNLKTSFWHYFQPKRDKIGRGRGKKILIQNSVPTQPELEKSKKKNSKKVQKIKKPHSGFISSQNGIKQAEKARKKFQARIPFILDPGKKIPKNIAKKFKKLKNLFPVLFLAKTG